MKKAGAVGREQLVSIGTCLGKFTKTRKFFLHITALDYLAPYATVSLCFCGHSDPSPTLKSHIRCGRIRSGGGFL